MNLIRRRNPVSLLTFSVFEKVMLEVGGKINIDPEDRSSANDDAGEMLQVINSNSTKRSAQSSSDSSKTMLPSKRRKPTSVPIISQSLCLQLQNPPSPLKTSILQGNSDRCFNMFGEQDQLDNPNLYYNM